jgi:hypothetical protein
MPIRNVSTDWNFDRQLNNPAFTAQTNIGYEVSPKLKHSKLWGRELII